MFLHVIGQIQANTHLNSNVFGQQDWPVSVPFWLSLFSLFLHHLGFSLLLAGLFSVLWSLSHTHTHTQPSGTDCQQETKTYNLFTYFSLLSLYFPSFVYVLLVELMQWHSTSGQQSKRCCSPWPAGCLSSPKQQQDLVHVWPTLLQPVQCCFHL